eukprot:3740869-Prymnesium_polylepis.2
MEVTFIIWRFGRVRFGFALTAPCVCLPDCAVAVEARRAGKKRFDARAVSSSVDGCELLTSSMNSSSGRDGIAMTSASAG